MKVKEARAVVKAAEQRGDTGTVTALVSVFGNEDSTGDVVLPGAFQKSIDDWAASGNAIPVLWSHRMDDPNMVIGQVTKAEETAEGLQVTAQLDLDSPNGAQVYKLLKGRRIKNWSFAYDVKAGGFAERDGRQVYELRELKVHEVSPCIIGANQETRTDDVKSAVVDGFQRAQERYEQALRQQGSAKGRDAADAAYSEAVKARSAMFEARKQALSEGVTEEELEQDMAHTEDIAALKAQVAEFAGLLKAQQPLAVTPEVAAAAAEAKAQEAKKAEATMRQALIDVGDGISGPSAKKTDNLHPRVKATGGSDWGQKVLQSVSGADGYKGILASGAVPLTVPLDPEPIRIGVPVLSIRQLIPTVAGPSRFGYMRQTVRTNNAAPVARGALKPTSVFTWDRIDDRTRTIAHLSEPIARQDLRDAPSLQRVLDVEMRLGVDLALEAQIINGSGSGENMTGIANVSGSQAQAWDTNTLTTLRKAKTKLEVLSFVDGAAYVMHPNDWETVELLANNEADYYLGGPVQTVEVTSRRVWGLPVVTSTSQTAGVAHLVNFRLATELQVVEDVRLDWSENIYDPDALGAGVGASDFQRNMIRFRAEMDAGLKIFQPSAIVEIDLTA